MELNLHFKTINELKSFVSKLNDIHETTASLDIKVNVNPDNYPFILSQLVEATPEVKEIPKVEIKTQPPRNEFNRTSVPIYNIEEATVIRGKLKQGELAIFYNARGGSEIGAYILARLDRNYSRHTDLPLDGYSIVYKGSLKECGQLYHKRMLGFGRIWNNPELRSKATQEDLNQEMNQVKENMIKCGCEDCKQTLKSYEY